MKSRAAAATLIIAGALALAAGSALVVWDLWLDDEARETEPELVAPTPTPVPTQVATPTPSPAAAPLAPEMAAYRAVFVRKPAPLDGRAGGEIWIAGLDGSNLRRLAGDNESATLAGVAPHPSTGGEAAYFVSLDGGAMRTVWAVDIESGERLKLVTFEAPNDDDADASVSPDGRYVAYAHVGGIDYIDIANGQVRHLLDNGPEDCNASNCLGHGRPQWSPDGTLLMVRRGFWEGGTTVILDPFASEIAPITNDSPDGPSSAYWSSDGELACGHTGYGESFLNIAEAPNWTFAKVPGYEQPSWGSAIVASCAWVTSDLLAFAVDVSRPDTDGNVVPDYAVEVLTYDRSLGSAHLIAAFDQGIQIISAGLLTLPASRWVVTQNWITEPGSAESTLSQPEVYDVDTGARTPVLQSGDWVVAILPP